MDIALLEDRVQKLENYVKVVIAVAVILGAGGAWGWVLLSAANKKIEGLGNQIVLVENARDNAIAEVKQQQGFAVRAIDQQKDRQIEDFRKQSATIVQQSVTAELVSQIGIVRHWTDILYTTAASNHDDPGNWQKRVVESSAEAHRDLK